MRGDASTNPQAETVARDRRLIAAGQRPTYHATWSISPDGAVDVRVTELPVIHLFVPDRIGVAVGARLLIARTLGVPPDAFDVEVDASRSES
jgi:hypothetical protein